MLDRRIESFLAVYRNKSYTKAAEELCITQPAVSQHIRALEDYYGCKLLEYSNREIKYTEAGEIFYRYILNTMANEKIIMKKLGELKNKNKTLKFAATLTIGEFTLGPRLEEFMKRFEEYDITMYVDNTDKVLRMLDKGEIDFALVEGLFNKLDYETCLYKKANYILVANNKHKILKKDSLFLEDLIDQVIIVREKGSGSREILERALYDNNYNLKDFKNTIKIGNVNVIKEMVKSGMGLSFIYEDAVRNEINRGELVEVRLEDLIIEKEFNFIYLKDSIIKSELEIFYSFLREKP